jgi:hypothetical protein
MIPGVRIDAEIATAFWERAARDHNRNERPSNTKKFVRLGKRNKLAHTHQGVAFNELGELVDGQHRMHALMLLAEDDPDASMVVDITYNMPVETSTAYDGGASRNATDHATAHRIDNPRIVTRLLRLLHQCRSTEGKAANFKDVPALQPDEIVEMSAKFGEELFSAWQAVQPLRKVKGLNLTAAAVFYYLAKQAAPTSPVDEFVTGLAELEFSGKEDPRKNLHHWASNTYRYRVDVRHHLAQLILSFNAYITGKPRQNNKWAPQWGIPAVEAPAKPARKTVTATRRATARR